MYIDCKQEINLKNCMPKAEDVKSLTEFFYAFSDLTRLKIIILLTIKPLCVGEIVSVLELNQTTVSHQLQILRAQGIVDCNRNGKSIMYFIKNPNIEQMLTASVEALW